MNLSIKTIALFSKEIAIHWQDNSTSFICLELLRAHCPCAGCSGEKDVLGNIYKSKPLKRSESSFQVNAYEGVGLYGIRFFWKDGHHDGIYTFQLLKTISELKK